MPHYVGKVDVSSEILDRLGGYDAWAKLSWMLQHQWVQDTKYLISKRRNRDVGTPFTIDQILNPQTSEYKDLLPSLNPDLLRSVPEGKREEFRRTLIEGYLLGTDYVSPLWIAKPGSRDKFPPNLEQTGRVPDSNGGTQLDGELRRYWADKRFIFDQRRWSMPIDSIIISSYCDENDLRNSKQKFAEKLRIDL